MLGRHRASHLLELVVDSWDVQVSQDRGYMKPVLGRESCQDEKMMDSGN